MRTFERGEAPSFSRPQAQILADLLVRDAKGRSELESERAFSSSSPVAMLADIHSLPHQQWS